MAKHSVRVTIEPGVVRKVDDVELVDLDRQGLIYSSESGDYGSHKWQGEEPAATDDDAPAPSKAIKKGA